MKCKSCNKQIPTTQFGIAGVSATPVCRCGKVRLRERLKECTKCHAHSVEIQVKKHWYGYLLYCTCGHKWRVFR